MDATASQQLLLLSCGLARLVRNKVLIKFIHLRIFLLKGGRGANKALGRSLLEKNVDKQCCQREATNALFVVKNAYSK